jgi:hypothetical protein
MTLFGDRVENDYERALTLVENTVRGLGVDPAQCRFETEGGGNGFSLRRGSASMLVTLQHGTRADDIGTLRIVAPVVALPTDAAKEHALFRRLLNANAKDLSGTAFALVNGQVVVVSERSVQDLNASEVELMVRSVGRIADRFDDVLAAEFGVQRVADRTT